MGDRTEHSASVPRVAIIGCGSIGSLLDEHSPGGVHTHAGGWTSSSRAKLSFLVERDEARLREAGRARGVDALYDSAEALFAKEAVDIVSLCTPTEIRLPVIERALAAGVKTLLIEKPLAKTVAEAERIAAAIDAHGARANVNYIRRWEPMLGELAARLSSGELGRVQHVSAVYGKGIVNNGTHLIDLLRWFFGEVSLSRVLRTRTGGSDPTVDVELSVGAGASAFPAYLLGTDSASYSVFEIDLVTTAGRIRILDGGHTLSEQLAREDPRFRGYRTLGPATATTTKIDEALRFTIEDTIDLYLDAARAPRCSIHDALATLRIAEAIKDASA